MKYTAELKKVLILTVLVSLTSCTDYWWSRGQPPTVEALLAKSESKLEVALAQNSAKRANFSEISTQLKLSILETIENHSKIQNAINDLNQLEGKISYGSRPAYAELSGQLRAFESSVKNKSFSKEAFTLYASRVFDFLSNELVVDYQA